MRQNTTAGQPHGLLRQLLAGIMLGLLSACSAVPKSDTVGENAVAIQVGQCDASSEKCKSAGSERYHYYLGLLSIYLIGL